MHERSGAIRASADRLLDALLKDGFARCEALAGVNARLEVRSHPGHARGSGPDGKRLRLLPRLVLFADGRVYEPRTSAWNTTGIANWAATGLRIFDGFEFLAAPS